MMNTELTDREIDALVAEHIFGWVWMRHHPKQTQMRGYVGNNPRFLLDPAYLANIGDYEEFLFVPAGDDAPPPNYEGMEQMPRYSTDIAAAWSVVRHMQKDWKHNLHLTIYSYSRTYAFFGLEPLEDEFSEGNGEHATEQAICLAALKAVTEQD